MATRATIKIEGVKFAKVYKHWDGNPESTLPWLEQFNKEFIEERGKDPEYQFAQLLRSSKKDEEEFNLDKNDYTGWGVVPYNEDCGEDFEYTLHSDGSVTYKEI